MSNGEWFKSLTTRQQMTVMEYLLLRNIPWAEWSKLDNAVWQQEIIKGAEDDKQ